jgi:hypothetical protein
VQRQPSDIKYPGGVLDYELWDNWGRLLAKLTERIPLQVSGALPGPMRPRASQHLKSRLLFMCGSTVVLGQVLTTMHSLCM